MINSRILKLLREPHISEKASLCGDAGQFVFKVERCATKPEIKRAVESLFDVKVKSVRTLIRKGAVRRTMRGVSKRSDVKIAYVSLEAGYDIVFPDAE